MSNPASRLLRLNNAPPPNHIILEGQSVIRVSNKNFCSNNSNSNPVSVITEIIKQISR